MNLIIYGTRPEEIKLYPFTHYKDFKFCEVNQSEHLHQDLIKPDYRINEQGLKSFIKRGWGRIIVQGDTRTTFYATLYAFENKIPVVHIEAGLRTWDLTQPFPEEGYRQMVDILATFKYCSTPKAVKNCDGKYVGQTSIDTLFEFIPPIQDKGYTIVTVHRNENFERLSEIIKEIKKVKNPVIFAHPNKVGQALKKHFKTRPPLNYKKFVKLLAECHAIMTDSGGLQEEAIALGKPCVVLRKKLERSMKDKYQPGATKKIVKDLYAH